MNISRRGERGSYLYSGLYEVQSEGQGLPHEDVWVVGGLKGLLQLLQLPAAVVGPSATLLRWPLFIWKAPAQAPITQLPTGDKELMALDWIISAAFIRPTLTLLGN